MICKPNSGYSEDGLEVEGFTTNSNCFSSTVDVVEQALKLCEIEVVDAVKFRMLAVSQFHSQEMFWT